MNQGLQQLIAVVQALKGELGKVIIGQHEVIDRVLVALLTGQHALIEGVPGIGKTLLVRTLAKAFLSGPITPEERQRHSQLVAREMGHQSKAFRLLVQEAMLPFMEMALRMWRSCLPYQVEPERLKLMVFSIFSQVLYFNFARPVVTVLTGREYDEAFVEQVVEHITQFALNGLNGGKAQ